MSGPVADDGQDEAEAGGGVRARSRARIEASIRRAAEEVFAEMGFEGASTSLIAKRAGLPKANLHYYFKTKNDLYQFVLRDIIELWLNTAQEIQPDADPATALAHYIAQKIDLARDRPIASRVFANEVLHGAPRFDSFMRRDLKDWVDEKAAIIDGWVAQGRMDRVDPKHLFFMIWATTQTYADFAVQVAAVLGRRELTDADYALAADQITRIILKGCGLNGPGEG
ncbi:MAG: TetR family transcriptional regulator C-terminal domain-containing protein [Rhodospirillaceae bacterium]|nr:TetR family transcriptional regulator C-terminal domain-containing protein [Rhodospirillaceae bacterium]